MIVHKHAIRFITLLILIYFTSGCAVNRMDADIMPGTDLSTLKSVYVVRIPADNRGVNKIIATRFEEQGITATTGDREKAPDDIDAVVTYIDKWMWDITMYMLELTIVIRNPDSDFPLAKGNSLHTSLTRKSPKEMVDEVITNIFNEAKQRKLK